MMFTDVAGYTAMGQRNEALALGVVVEQRNMIRPILDKHKGREVKTMGDAFLVEFHSALDAVRCAYDIQRASRELNLSLPTDRQFGLRIGVHLGDVIESQGDVLGDAVNVASRIEPLAEVGGVCLSRQVYDNIQNKFELPMIGLGSRTLKNVSSPLEVYKIVMPWEKQKVSADVLNPKRIAVMPFANMSPDPGDEYLSDGMTEELISTMSRIEQFEVISRTSVMQFKKNPKPIREIAKELDAGTVLEGSVRKAGSRLRVTVQMIDAARDRHTWAESYDREMKDIFSIQTEIARAVAEELKIRIVPGDRAKLEKEPTPNTEAYALYLKGKYFLNERTKDGLQKANQYFTEATKRDPDFARAFAGLADCYLFQEVWGYVSPTDSHSKRRTYVIKALELDDSLPEAHAALASLLGSIEWNWPGAEREYRRAIELNPNYAPAHHGLANAILGPQGRFDEAIHHLREALRLDPLSAISATNIGDQLLFAGRFKEADEQYRSVLDSSPDFAYAYSRLGLVLLKESRYEEAVSVIKKSVEMSSRGSIAADLIYAYRIAGLEADAERLLGELEATSRKEYVSNTDFAMAYGAIGQKEKAIEFLERAFLERSSQLRLNMNEPHFDEIRSDPRFVGFLKKLGMEKLNRE